MFDPSLLVIKPLFLMALAFVVSMALLPTLIQLLVRYRMGKTIRDAASAPLFASLHQAKAGRPTMGGIIVWGTMVLLLAFLSGGCAVFGKASHLCGLTFWSRSQTWLPIGLMLAAAMVGLVDDYLNIRRLGAKGGGLRERERLLSYGLIAVIGAWWFFTKLGWQQLHVPFLGTYDIGWWYVPFFILTVVATSHSVNVTDGLDGLAGGTLLASFGAYAVIAWSQGRTDLAMLCVVVMGALTGFLWFNINPAQVFMGDTGSMAMGTLLATVALMTNQPLLLPIIGLPFVLESLSVLIQIASKKLRNGKKVFKIAPFHHHLEATGWTEPQIVMRTWLISFMLAGVGTVLALIDRL